LDLKKLLQRELKMAPPTSDDDFTITQSVPPQTSMFGRSMSHVRNGSSVSVDSVGIHVSVTPAEMVSQSGMSGTSLTDHVADVRNGSSVSLDLASAAGVHKSATLQADVSSPATLTISDHLTFNGQYTPTNCSALRSGRDQRGHRSSTGSQAGVVMSPADCEYDFVRELNFRYLRHVVLKFMLSREAEVLSSFTNHHSCGLCTKKYFSIFGYWLLLSKKIRDGIKSRFAQLGRGRCSPNPPTGTPMLLLYLMLKESDFCGKRPCLCNVHSSVTDQVSIYICLVNKPKLFRTLFCLFFSPAQPI